MPTSYEQLPPEAVHPAALHLVREQAPTLAASSPGGCAHLPRPSTSRAYVRDPTSVDKLGFAAISERSGGRLNQARFGRRRVEPRAGHALRLRRPAHEQVTSLRCASKRAQAVRRVSSELSLFVVL